MDAFFKHILILFFTIICCSNLAAQGDYDLDFKLISTDNTPGGFVEVKVRIKAANADFGLGSSNLVFNYQSAAISSPALVAAHNFSGGAVYGAMTVTQPNIGRVSVNVELFTIGFGTMVSSDYVDVATIRFTLVDPAISANLSWRGVVPNATIVYADDEVQLLTPGKLKALPVLAPIYPRIQTRNSNIVLPAGGGSFNYRMSFTNTMETAANVDLWARLQTPSGASSQLFGPKNKTFNAGANVRKNRSQSLAASDAPGDYAIILYTGVFPDNSFASDTLAFNKSATVLRGGQFSANLIPLKTDLVQNYPNPFNPSTTIAYQLATDAQVSIKVYNSLGQEVRTLVEGVEAAGFKQITWDGKDSRGNWVASGIYLYKMTAKAISTDASSTVFTKTRRMLFTR